MRTPPPNCPRVSWRSTARSISPGRRASAPCKAGDFFKGLFETALGPHDVLSAIRFPAATADTRVGFAELARRHGDYAMVGLAAAAKANGKALSDVRLCYFGVGATPVRARKAEAALAAGSVDEAVKALDLDPRRRHPGDRRGEEASRRRAAAARRRSSSRSRAHERRHPAHRERRGGRRDPSSRAPRWSISCARRSGSPAAMSAASTACAAPARCCSTARSCAAA